MIIHYKTDNNVYVFKTNMLFHMHGEYVFSHSYNVGLAWLLSNCQESFTQAAPKEFVLWRD